MRSMWYMGFFGLMLTRLTVSTEVRASAGLGCRAGSVLGGDGAVADVARDGGAAGVDGWLRDPRRWGVGVRDSVGKLGRGWIWQNGQDTVSRAPSRLGELRREQ
jgi:hypothetical protein